MISVIIPSYNSGKTIRPVLQALYNQTCREKYEIIVVDSSDDRTPEIVKKEFPAVHFFHYNRKTDPGTARNKGIQMSSGDPVLFIDSDCRANPDWIENMVSLHRRYPYAAIGGAVLNGNHPSSEIAWAGYMAEFREYLPSRKTGFVDHIPTCNISYKRQALLKVGAFHSEYYPQEDLEFNYRLQQLGMQLYFDPSIRVQHQHRETITDFFRHQLGIGRITSHMLKILPLSGTFLARNPVLTFPAILFLPMIKFFNTMRLFLKEQPKIIFTHIPAVVIFAFGLFPWLIGFFQGAFYKDVKN